MFGEKEIKEFVAKLEEIPFEPTPRDYKESGFIRKNFGWMKRTKHGTVIYYNSTGKKR